ncbi:MAG: DNA damage-inducible protein D [Lentisphaerae bacterium]|nr:DNA damage-inducible protein D [Lentisphaerota bacterium]
MKKTETTLALDTARQTARNGSSYWRARDLQVCLQYEEWRNFDAVIGKAMTACENSGAEKCNHFVETTKMVTIGSDAQRTAKDYFLSRYACYLVAMNGDPSKPHIAAAQTYFAVQTRRQEQTDSLTEQEKRIHLRARVKDANKHLTCAAKAVGVQQYGLFHDAGYRGLYGMGLSAIKQRKRLAKKDDLLDHSGRAELAANEFRITQTEQALKKDSVRGQKRAEETHHRVGAKVRRTIAELGGTMPENLPPEPSIKKLSAAQRKALRAKREGE